MSGFLNSLVNQDDACGPVNPIAQLSKGLQGEGSQLGRDRFLPLAGPSSGPGAFRGGLQAGEASNDAAAAAFFHGHPSASPAPLDLRNLHHALPQDYGRALPQAYAPSASPAWAADFMQNKPSSPAQLSERAWQKSRQMQPTHEVPTWAHDFAAHTPPGLVADAGFHQAPIHGHLSPANVPALHGHQQWHQGPYNDAQAGLYNNFIMGDAHSSQLPTNTVSQNKRDDVSWDQAFEQHHTVHSRQTMADAKTSSRADEVHESFTARPTSPSQMHTANVPDLLARTAGELLQNVSGDLQTNEKMRGSSFMALMHKLRDRQAVVEGDKIVEKSGVEMATTDPHSSSMTASTSSGPQPICVWPNQSRSDGISSRPIDASSQHHTIESLTDAYEEMNATLDETGATAQVEPGRAFQGDGGRMLEDDRAIEDIWQSHLRRDTAVPGASAAWEEDFDLDNQLLRSGPQPPTLEQSLRINQQQQEWADYQDQWDLHQASATGLDALNTAAYSDYAFQMRNPYLLSHNRAHLPSNTVLEKEADVQLSPENASAWLSLGLKQQEAEREPLAIQALLRALELDSTLREAWLALAVSYTNDNIRGKAYSAIERWCELKTEYAEVIEDYASRMSALGQGSSEDGDMMSLTQRHAYLSGLLVEMARAGASAGGHVDADVQIALGVMFNASEEYEKACDCFSAALTVRPEDPHLYNRLGATLANSGRSHDAMEYYYKALEIQPDFARATFNLAIACMNLGQNTEAAEHLLRSLVMQQNSAEDQQMPAVAQNEHVEASNLLWETLSTCCTNLKRPKLTEACNHKDLSTLLEAFVI